MTCRILFSSLLALAFLASCGVETGRAAMIDFDSLPAGVYVTNQYAGDGVLFSGGDYFQTSDLSGGGNILKPTAPNMLALNGVTPILGSLTFVDPNNPLIPATTDHVEFENPGLVTSAGTFFAGFAVSIYDIHDTLLAFQVVGPVGPGQSRPIFTTQFTMPGIHRMQFERIENTFDPAFVAIDNLSFTTVTPTPEPGSMVLLIVGMLGAGALAVWKRG